ncbi:MAG: hypothetical protein P4M14_07260 [Gammaproteobacteria bacterium]|nr:hypothetical protein [Gammaproteobacteria bacterium]
MQAHQELKPDLTLVLDHENDDSRELAFKRLEERNPDASASALRYAATLTRFASMHRYSNDILPLLELAASVCKLDMRSLRVLGFIYYTDGRYLEAINCFEDYIDAHHASQSPEIRSSDLTSCYFYRGNCHFELGNYEAAKYDYFVGMGADDLDDCISLKTKTRIVSDLSSLNVKEFQKKGLNLTKRKDHAVQAEKMLAMKKYSEGLKHAEQAIMLNPASADLYLLRSRAQRCMLTQPYNQTLFRAVIVDIMYASWLITAKIDKISKADAAMLRHEANHLYSEFDILRQQNKKLREDVLHLAPSIQAAEPAPQNLHLILQKIKELLPDLANSTDTLSAATALYHLYKDNVSEITREECEKIFFFLNTPAEIPAERLTALDEEVFPLADAKQYTQVLNLLDQAIVDYPRFHDLYVERARIRMAQEIGQLQPEKTLADLNLAFWLYQSQLNHPINNLTPYYLQSRNYFLSIGEYSKSLIEHQKLLALTSANKREETNCQYVELIQHLFKNYPNFVTDEPAKALALLKLSHAVMPTAYTKAKIAALKMKVAEAAKNATPASVANDEKTKVALKNETHKKADTVPPVEADATLSEAQLKDVKPQAKSEPETKSDAKAAASATNKEETNKEQDNAIKNAADIAEQQALRKKAKMDAAKERKLQRRAERKAGEPLTSIANAASTNRDDNPSFNAASLSNATDDSLRNETPIVGVPVSTILGLTPPNTGADAVTTARDSAMLNTMRSNIETTEEVPEPDTKTPSDTNVPANFQTDLYSDMPLASDWEKLYDIQECKEPRNIQSRYLVTNRDAINTPPVATQSLTEVPISLLDEIKQQAALDATSGSTETIPLMDAEVSESETGSPATMAAADNNATTQNARASEPTPYSAEDLESNLIYQLQGQRAQIAAQQREIEAQKQRILADQKRLQNQEHQILNEQTQLQQLQQIICLQQEQIAQLQSDRAADQSLIYQFNQQMQMMAIQSLVHINAPLMNAPTPQMAPFMGTPNMNAHPVPQQARPYLLPSHFANHPNRLQLGRPPADMNPQQRHTPKQLPKKQK